MGITLEQNLLGAQIIKIKFSTKNLQRLFLISCVLLGVLGSKSVLFANNLTISHLGLNLEQHMLGAQIIKIKFSTKILQRLFLIPCFLLGVLGRNQYCLQLSHYISLRTHFRTKFVGCPNN